jgi:hypothetical protein
MILASNSGEVRAEKIENHSILFRSQDFYFGSLSFVQGCNGRTLTLKASVKAGQYNYAASAATWSGPILNALRQPRSEHST